MTGNTRRVPTALAALALGVPEGTIRQWSRRGRITRYGTKRQALYDLSELAALAEEPRATPRG
ncbi:helix-turn-helix domain-containing protein [Streptomyces sp. H27-D2]|uniref:helix-turn-helix domain-containing protein n=1 Tax=Streptomyces sp. H27-D2 TaxID=3046304 RepID=UPI002DB80401|nr:helix-turn-helix domain-containing protein [Streptomyces sp. H27-D2]MEC4015047.1 helix-turn-helix domain-containing protein [Streptomyces sp. H27-D2]